MANTITRAQIDEIVRLAELEDESATATYSGRFMYGEQCVGFEVDGTGQTLALGAALLTVMGDDFPEMLSDARSDSMGLGTIVYFPDFQSEEYALYEATLDEEKEDEYA